MPRTLLYTDQVYNLITHGARGSALAQQLVAQLPHAAGSTPGCCCGGGGPIPQLLDPGCLATRPIPCKVVNRHGTGSETPGPFAWYVHKRAGWFCTGSPYICPGDKFPQERLTAMVRVHHLALLASLACIHTLCTIDSRVPPCRGHTVAAAAC